ncbi:alpha/beta fold hydrolase [Geodermatophilus sp. URMC 62]|uniref:alpha/beta fold hydrolase n=1 Tax=Geodermatophilus sp. URMC 62 TaxID=3423414 RepID=UPI00406BF96D
MLHPATGTAATWSPRREPLTAAGFRVIAYTRRGHLGSTAVDPDHPVPAAEDLRALIGALGLGPVHLVGAALGGFYAVDFALAFPDLLRSLSVAGSMLGISDESWRAALDRVELPHAAELPPEFLELGPSYRAENPDGVETWRRIADSARPVPAPFMELAASRLPRARYVSGPDAGHAIAWERPGPVNAALLEFLRAAWTPDRPPPCSDVASGAADAPPHRSP